MLFIGMISKAFVHILGVSVFSKKLLLDSSVSFRSQFRMHWLVVDKMILDYLAI